MHLDQQERLALCELFETLGPAAPTLIQGWTTHGLVAHLVLRERDPIAGPCMVLPGPFQGVAERRRLELLHRQEFDELIARLRSGPPAGFFRIGWVRSMASLNEFFVHHEDVRRANGLGPRDPLSAALDIALWRNVRRGGRYLSRRLRGAGLELRWAGTSARLTPRPARPGHPAACISGSPGEILLYLFGRQDAACVDVTGSAAALAAVHRTQFGM
jgi:uncharacterized protein (TIGR03085 family)